MQHKLWNCISPLMQVHPFMVNCKRDNLVQFTIKHGVTNQTKTKSDAYFIHVYTRFSHDPCIWPKCWWQHDRIIFPPPLLHAFSLIASYMTMIYWARAAWYLNLLKISFITAITGQQNQMSQDFWPKTSKMILKQYCKIDYCYFDTILDFWPIIIIKVDIKTMWVKTSIREQSGKSRKWHYFTVLKPFKPGKRQRLCHVTMSKIYDHL